MINRIINDPETKAKNDEPIENPSLEDLHELMSNDPFIKHTYKIGIQNKLSFEQILILIIQSLAHVKEEFVKKEYDRLTQLKPDPESIKELNKIKHPWYNKR